MNTLISVGIFIGIIIFSSSALLFSISFYNKNKILNKIEDNKKEELKLKIVLEEKNNLETKVKLKEIEISNSNIQLEIEKEISKRNVEESKFSSLSKAAFESIRELEEGE